MKVPIPAIAPTTVGWTRYGGFGHPTAQPIMELRELAVNRERYQHFLASLQGPKVTRKNRC